MAVVLNFFGVMKSREKLTKTDELPTCQNIGDTRTRVISYIISRGSQIQSFRGLLWEADDGGDDALPCGRHMVLLVHYFAESLSPPCKVGKQAQR